ncbi:TfuA-like protein [Ruegeria sp. WL0004]|uniref:TfuA-like protein n=1 Tax=Ruegeria marisflavi TaxID=2984152 RepID=A0ABT2WPV8_9RHOB|nr:TfuA-like protein [Ruegeria sp. WL0004]MCU9837939.1 TfuA-like protein [Ruegeria sp. WL0004]
MNDIVVFLGPTLSRQEARRALDAHFLPPVSQGDIISVANENPRAIGIIDGYFQLVPAVWHKEILYALDKGIPVVGAASMGALRAAELDAFGMVGVGRIYQWYRSGFLEADDEVAVIHSPFEIGHHPLSEAMVNIRATLDLAVRNIELSKESAIALLEACAATPYWERSFDRLLADGKKLGLSASELKALERCERVDQKRRDALEMLERMAQGPATGVDTPDFRFNRTSKFDRLVEQDTCLARDGDTRITISVLADFYRLHGHRLFPGADSFALAQAGGRANEVVDALRLEGRLDTVLGQAVACDQSDGLRPCEGDDRAVLERYCRQAGLGLDQTATELGQAIGLHDSERFIERLHRFTFRSP